MAQNISDCIYFQNLYQPDIHVTYKLEDQQFVQFCDFKSLDDICFIDKRTNLFNNTPFD